MRQTERTHNNQRLLARFPRRGAFSFLIAGLLLLLGARLSAAQATAAASPPSSLDADAAVRAAGREIAALAAKRDAKAIAARFTSQMARAASAETLQALLDQLLRDPTPLGPVVSESVREEGGGVRAYLGEYKWRADRNLSLSVAFAPGGTDKIAGMYLRPALLNQAAALQSGRDLDALVVKGDTAALEARFTPEMAAQAPEATLRQALSTVITPTTPLGTRASDRVEDAGHGLLLYTAEHTWKTDLQQPMDVLITFEAGGAGRIAGLLLRPGTPKRLPPDPKAGYPQKATLRLPFAPGDIWYVFWGGNTLAQNYHVIAPDQRHAFDFVAMKEGYTHDGDGTKNEQYFAWGRTIVAPAAGTVVETVNDMPDNAPGQTDSLHPFGNHVVLDLGHGEYAVFAHLQKGSVRVTTGQKVRPGDTLGKCGNSGNTSEPHLHFHVQDRPTLGTPALGLPITFTGYISDGKPVAHGSPVKGETVAVK